MLRKKCKYCGQQFMTNRRTQRFCSKECRIDYQEIKKNYRIDTGRGQPCWICQNACGGCSWSRELKPIEGWDAKIVTVKNKDGADYRTYKILSCPKFIQESDVKIQRR